MRFATTLPEGVTELGRDEELPPRHPLVKLVTSHVTVGSDELTPEHRAALEAAYTAAADKYAQDFSGGKAIPINVNGQTAYEPVDYEQNIGKALEKAQADFMAEHSRYLAEAQEAIDEQGDTPSTPGDVVEARMAERRNS